jgi:TolA-binding protein
MKHIMKQRLLPLLLLISILPACSGDQSAEWLETAQFEERQNNIAHARQLYEDIIRSYPDSPAARTARTRLDALQKQ